MKTDTPAAEAAQPCAAARRGRPRSEAAEQAIFTAVEDLMAGGTALSELTIEGIATAAGVGKATIYRRWPNKEALLVDVVSRLEVPMPEPTGGGARDDLVAVIDYMRRRGLAKRSRWLLKAAFGQLHSLPELSAAYRDRVVRPRREAALELVRRAVDEGVLRSDLDVDLLCDLLMGPILYRSILWDDSDLEDPELARTMVDALLDGLAPRPAAS
ncbi:TetR/AcrR family transcriptional regulator [Streptomyces kaniharaensis]|uniref:TetR/AcrR family transcriptional regulator n=1 Tax=Streptomyces kaniharaensis TaxID=212423 RepID=A0A6N7KQU2_9ACTN|nr:TetR/AcrR family transcriptional regulator [Streptomyces kaniharaensis]MQS11973.1 TetR/AcrR family transcriptional regulator [Streptomyces kaniharaensis]